MPRDASAGDRGRRTPVGANEAKGDFGRALLLSAARVDVGRRPLFVAQPAHGSVATVTVAIYAGISRPARGRMRFRIAARWRVRARPRSERRC